MPDDGVTAATCAELRRAAKRGTGLADLAETYRLEYGAVARHVRGRCDHGAEEPPAPME